MTDTHLRLAVGACGKLPARGSATQLLREKLMVAVTSIMHGLPPSIYGLNRARITAMRLKPEDFCISTFSARPFSFTKTRRVTFLSPAMRRVSAGYSACAACRYSTPLTSLASVAAVGARGRQFWRCLRRLNQANHDFLGKHVEHFGGQALLQCLKQAQVRDHDCGERKQTGAQAGVVCLMTGIPRH